MANYLISHYKGKYRIRSIIDPATNDFLKHYDNELSDCDLYIDCNNNIKIVYHGNGILKAYIPSLKRGRNILKAINEIDNKIIKCFVETDSEIVIVFNAKYMEIIESVLKPKTSGASIPPFSPKNLPWNKDYKIPDKALNLYKEITSNLSIKHMKLLADITDKFLEKLATRKNTIDMIKSDMRMKMLHSKEYIYSIGKWNEYMKYLKTELELIEEK